MVAWAIPAAVAAGSALFQWVNSAEGQKASVAERKRMEELLSKIEDPNFDTSTITPEEYKVAQRYVPEVASFVEEQAPETVKLASEDAKLGRQAMREGLAGLQRAATDATERNMSIAEALDAARMESGARDASLKQDFAARGQTGTGMEMASRLMGAQQGGKTAAEVTRTATRDAYRQGLQNLMSAANLGGDIENRERNLESSNVGIINSWNQRNAQNRNAYNQDVANTMNSANKYNVGNVNEADNKNVGARNDAAREGQRTRNQYAQQGFNNELAKYGREADLSRQTRDDIASGTRQTNEAVSGLAQGAQIGLDQYGRANPSSANMTGGDETENDWQARDQWNRRRQA